MEKRRPHYDLKAILAQMIGVEDMNLTMSAQQGIRVADMTRNEALEVITMKSKWNNKQCPLCLEGTLHEGSQTKTLEYRGRKYESTIDGAFCDQCHDGFPNYDECEEAEWKIFRDKVDAEEVAELARIRKKLKLTQKEAALITGGGHNAFSRYERGEAKPIQAVLNLFRLLDHHPDLLNELKN